MSTILKLSEGTLEIIMNGGDVTEPIMQVLGSKKLSSNTVDKERYRLLLSDGKHSISFAMFSTQINDKVGMEAIQMYSIIKIKSYIANVINMTGKGDTRIVLILTLDLIAKGEEVGETIGNPTPLIGPEGMTLQVANRYVGTSNSSNSNGIISPISSLCPYHNNWVIKARVINKSNVKTWSNFRGEGKLFSLDLIDNTGEMRCTVFQELVDKFYNLFQVDKVYHISKGIIKPANKQFNASDTYYEMTLTDESVIEESLTDNDSVAQMKYNFTSIDKIAVMEVGTTVDIIGICKGVSEIQEFVSKTTHKQLKKKELTLVDQSQIAISVVMWGAEAEHFQTTASSVILVKGAKLSEFAGAKSLSLIMGSLIKTNPDLVESHRLRAWYDLTGHQLDYQNISSREGNGFGNRWMSFREVYQQQNLHERPLYFQTYATILFARSDRAVYKACPSTECQKKVIDMENGMFRCEKCNREYPDYKYRFLMMANIADCSGNQWVTLFASEAEKILGKTADEVAEMMNLDQDAVAKVFDEAQYKSFVFRCRAKLETYNDEERCKIVVISSSSVNAENYNSYLIQKIENYSAQIST